MERGYNEYSMSLINQGMEKGLEKGVEIGQEKARLDCGMNLVRENNFSVKAAAKTCRVDETKLADYIESEAHGNPN